MLKKSKISTIVIIGLILGMLGSAFPAFANPVPEQGGRLQVAGTAVVAGEPDTAYISLGVETNDPSAEKAAAENGEKMAAIRKALQELGLTDKDIQTSGYNIYSYNQTLNRGTEQETIITTYTVQNRIEITTKNLTIVGQIVDAAVSAGANQVQGIRFDIADKQELQLKALANAIQQAHNKAETMAEAAGIKIGGLVDLREELSSYAPMYDAPVMRAQALNSVETAITPGDVEITAKVNLIFWF